MCGRGRGERVYFIWGNGVRGHPALKNMSKNESRGDGGGERSLDGGMEWEGAIDWRKIEGVTFLA